MANRKKERQVDPVRAPPLKEEYDVQIYAQKIKRAREIVRASGLSSDAGSPGFELYKIAFAVVLEKLL